MREKRKNEKAIGDNKVENKTCMEELSHRFSFDDGSHAFWYSDLGSYAGVLWRRGSRTGGSVPPLLFLKFYSVGKLVVGIFSSKNSRYGTKNRLGQKCKCWAPI